MRTRPSIFYAGDSAPDGAARYLLAVLRSLKVNVTHIAPSRKLLPRHLKADFDAILLSDYPRANADRSVQMLIAEKASRGTGLMMIGGWASFSGPFGGWRGSIIEGLLPVKCGPRDDRINFPGGAYPVLAQSHAAFDSFSFKNPPAIVGANDVRPKAHGRVVIALHRLISVGSNQTLDPVPQPLWVIDSDPAKRIAAYTSDFAPHWCGGMVDWGPKTVRLTVAPRLGWVEVGTTYVQFISRIIRWLTELA